MAIIRKLKVLGTLYQIFDARIPAIDTESDVGKSLYATSSGNFELREAESGGLVISGHALVVSRGTISGHSLVL
jgi:hypothetical protein